MNREVSRCPVPLNLFNTAKFPLPGLLDDSVVELTGTLVPSQ